MNDENTNKVERNPEENTIERLSVIKYFRSLLRELRPHADCFNRKLHYDQYVSLLLLYFFNPTLSGLRSLQQASSLRNVQKKLDIEQTSLGSLSESSDIFDPELLKPIMDKLVDKANSLPVDKRLDKVEKSLVAVDGSLLKALPKMLWALWVDKDHRAVKMHLELDIIKATPLRVQLTDANANEAANLNANLTSGKLYVLDAGYRTYSLYGNIIAASSSFVARLQYNADYDLIKENTLSDDDRQAGVISDKTVWLGCKKTRGDVSKPLRIITVNCPEKKNRNRRKLKALSHYNKSSTTESTQSTLLIATDLMDLPAELIALIYRYRWQIEIFFRWFKCVLSAEHLLCHSQNGITIQIYTALIATLLIRLWTCRKPTKRTFEMICLYFQGLATLDELLNGSIHF
jgi:hypothetical protein